MAVDLESYEGQLARMDHRYILEAGEEIRARLFPRENKYGETPYPMPIGLAYQPGNGTRYDLVFTPVRTIQQPLVWEGERSPAGCFDKEGNVIEGYVLVAYLSDSRSSAHPFQLSFGEQQHASYVGSALSLEFGDACVLTALLNGITGMLVVPASDVA